MEKKRISLGFLSIIGIIVLILDSRTAFEGASQGVELCRRTVIPSLFPFFLCSLLLTASAAEGRWMVPLEKLFCIPHGTAPILVPAFLAGYPVGAKTAADYAQRGIISSNTAERMLAFCSNAGPAFLFGILSPMFPGKRLLFLIWGGQILGAAAAARVFPSDTGQSASLETPIQTDIMKSAISAMAKVCGWVILLRTILAFLDRWFFWMLPIWQRVLLSGLLELSNGCCRLPQITDINLRLIVCSIILSLGGLCVTMQTVSVTSGLSLRCYLCGKLIQCAVGSAVCTAWIIGKMWVLLFIPALIPFLYRKSEKRSRFSRFAGV